MCVLRGSVENAITLVTGAVNTDRKQREGKQASRNEKKGEIASRTI